MTKENDDCAGVGRRWRVHLKRKCTGALFVHEASLQEDALDERKSWSLGELVMIFSVALTLTG